MNYPLYALHITRARIKHTGRHETLEDFLLSSWHTHLLRRQRTARWMRGLRTLYRAAKLRRDWNEAVHLICKLHRWADYPRRRNAYAHTWF